MRAPNRGSLSLPVTAVASLALLLSANGACASGAAPSIDSESASQITPTGATLEATINPSGAPAGVYYQFQIASDLGESVSEIICPPEPSSGPAHPCIGAHSDTALPIGFLAAGSEPGSVSLDLGGAGVTLQPGATYDYRVLVAKAIQSEDTIEWESPAIVGAVQEFTTPLYPPPASGVPQASGVEPPVAQSISAPHRHRHHRRSRRRLRHRGVVHRTSLAG
jgi:hypothetical protein